jgi:Trypsin-like peptidase domain/Effector-associated domain 1
VRSGNLQQELLAALLDAFRQPGEMNIVVSNADIGTSFANFRAAEVTYEVALFNLLQWVEAQDRLVPFLRAARQKNPGNPKLKKVTARFAPLEDRFKSLRPDVDLGQAEQLVLQGATFEDVAVWLAKLGRMRRAVCRVEPQPLPNKNGYGTGYLVSPDVVMTNFHVAEAFWQDRDRAARVILRFDYEAKVGGAGVLDGVEHQLAQEWRGPNAPPNEQRDYPWQVLASPKNKLDFALLRLAKAAGEEIADGAARGSLTLTARELSDGDPLLILQHPDADPLKLSFGSVTEPIPPDRVLYKVNTEGGSSGSPCLAQNLDVVAIHHWGGDDTNRGVTHEAIREYLASKRADLKLLGLEQLAR